MLTKDLIRFRRDKSKIYPEFIKVKDFSDTGLVRVAEEFVSFFVVGVSRKEIKKFVEDISFKYFKYLRFINCFNKILLDEAQFSKSSFIKERMDYIVRAQDIRRSSYKEVKDWIEGEKDYLDSSDKDSYLALDYERYIDLVMNGDQTESKVDIYKDHPDYSRIEDIPYLESKDLLGLYNTRVLEWFLKSWESITIKTKLDPEDKKDIFRVFKECRVNFIDLKEKIEEGKTRKKKNSKKESEEFLINKEDNKVGMEKILQCLFYVLEKDSKADIVVELDSREIVGGKSLYRYFYLKLDNSIPFKYYNFKLVMKTEAEKENIIDIDMNLDINIEP